MKSITFSRVVISVAVSTLCIASAAQASSIPASQLGPYTGTGGAAYLYHLDSSGVNSGSAGATGNLGAVSGSSVRSSLNSNFNNALSGSSPGSVSGDDAVSLLSMTNAAGSFSVEAIVNVPVAPQNFFIANYGGESESAPNSVNGSWYLTYNDNDQGGGRLQFVIRNRKRDANGNWDGNVNKIAHPPIGSSGPDLKIYIASRTTAAMRSRLCSIITLKKSPTSITHTSVKNSKKI